MTPLADIIRVHDLNIISYAEDTRLILSLSADPSTTTANFHKCMKSIADWMKNNFLKFNTDKTEVPIFGNNASPWNDPWWPAELGPTPTDSTCNLCIMLDSKLTIKRQINATSTTCFHTLHMLRRIFKWLPIITTKTVTQALVTTRPDCGKALYAGTTTQLMRRL